jgi:4'-phosphopantetheinyl transferase EntD
MSAFTFPGAETIAVELLPVADHRAQLLPEEQALVAGAVSKRQHEFASGRAAVRALMARMQLPPAPILRDDRAPRWPADLVGSIAHTDAWAMATLTRRDRVLGIGLDLERPDRIKREMLRLILTPAEAAHFGTRPDLNQALVIFSAKEAVYKAMSPIVGAFIGFREVEIDITHDGFRARYVGHKGFGIMSAGRGYVARHADFVATLFVVNT